MGLYSVITEMLLEALVSCVYLLLKMLFIICVDITGTIFHPFSPLYLSAMALQWPGSVLS